MIVDFQIFERKSVGIIYHFTSLYGLRCILEQNRMINVKDFISLTRCKHPYNILLRENRPVRFTLDGDKLSDNYKIEPYNDFGDDTRKYDENEERIHLNKKHKEKYNDEEDWMVHSIKNIRKYIIKIDINPNSDTINHDFGSGSFGTHLDLTRKYPDIEINLVEKW